MKKAVLFAGTAVLALSCQPEGVIETSEKVKVYVTLGVYNGPDGNSVSRTWNAADNVHMTDVNSGKSTECKPQTPGGTKAAFEFSLKNLQKGDKLVCIVNPSGGCNVEGSIVSMEMPTLRTSADVPVAYVGNTTFMSECTIEANPTCACVGVMVPQGAGRAVTSATLESNAGEKIAGDVTINVASGSVNATSSKIEYKLPSALDCTESSKILRFMVPPITFRRGFTVTFKCQDGTSFSESVNTSVKLGYGDTFVNESSRKLLVVGSGKVYRFDAKQAQKKETFVDCVDWTWTCTSHSSVVKGAVEGCYTDECKPVDGGEKIIVTCSDKNWLMLIKPDYDNGGAKLLFSLENVANVHTAAILPNNRIIVACSTGLDRLELYNIQDNAKMLSSYPLTSAHGLVWSEKYQRLYAVGGTTLQIYSLKNWDSASPELVLEETLSTSAYVSHIHDLMLVDENTLSMAGTKVALFDMGAKKFTTLQAFNSHANMKSFNYSSATGECYYTQAPAEAAEGDLAWATKVVRYRPSIKETSETVIDIPDILNLYKVRVLNW